MIPERESTFVIRRVLPPVATYVLVLLAAALLYGLTAQRSVSWQDSGMFQWRVLQGDYEGSLGLALAHPLYILLAQPLRLLGGDMPTWLNRLSGLGMAVAAANVFLLGYLLTGRQLAGLLAAALLAVAHGCWWLATIAEVYTWSAALLSTELLLLVWLLARPAWWRLAMLGLANGLGLSLHNMALVALPVYVVVACVLTARRRLAWWAPLAAGVGWVAGAGLYVGLVVQHGLLSGDWGATLFSALFGAGRENGYRHAVLNVSLGAVVRAAQCVLLSWPFLSLAPVLIGWWVMPRYAGRWAGSALGAITAIELIFAVRYDVLDQFTFFLPTYVMLAVGAAVGIARILEMPRLGRRVLLATTMASLAATPLLYGLAPGWLDSRGISIRPGGRDLAGRDEARYWITPWKVNEHSAQRFAEEASQIVQSAQASNQPRPVILADDTTGYPLLLMRHYRHGPDVDVLLWAQWAEEFRRNPAGFEADAARRPMYVVTDHPRYLPRGLLDRLRLVPREPLFRLEPAPHSPPVSPAGMGS